jgi:hypothetical protein
MAQFAQRPCELKSLQSPTPLNDCVQFVWRMPQTGAYPRAAAMGGPATPLPLHSLSSPQVTDRVMKHVHARQGLLAAVAKGAGERARHVRGGQPCFASSLSPTCPQCGLTVRGRRRQAAATSTLPAPSKSCTVT